MNSGAGRYAWPTTGRGPTRRAARQPARASRPATAGAAGDAARVGRAAARGRSAHATSLVLLAALIYPWVATPFFTFQIGAQSLALGLVALSLTFLAGYGGMVSLAQMTVAGIAGYMFAIFATQRHRHQPALAVGAGGGAGPRDRDGLRRRSSAGSRCEPRASTRS